MCNTYVVVSEVLSLYVMKSQQPLLLLLGVFTSLASASNHSSNSTDDEGLSGGALAGIIIGCIAVVALIGVAIWYFFLKEGAMYAMGSSGGSGSGSSSAASTSSAGGGNHLPMMALRVPEEDI